jgi:hypothetical protein
VIDPSALDSLFRLISRCRVCITWSAALTFPTDRGAGGDKLLWNPPGRSFRGRGDKLLRHRDDRFWCNGGHRYQLLGSKRIGSRTTVRFNDDKLQRRKSERQWFGGRRHGGRMLWFHLKRISHRSQSRWDRECFRGPKHRWRGGDQGLHRDRVYILWLHIGGYEQVSRHALIR